MSVIKQSTEYSEYELFTEYRLTHNKQLRDEIVNTYIYIAEILSRKFISRGIDYDDIYQVACLGLLYAVERFDPEKGVKFATYATPTVLGEIRHYFRDTGNFIKVPRRLYEVFYKAEKIRRSSYDGEKMSTYELSRILNLPKETIDKAYEIGDTAFIKSLEYEAIADGSMNLSNFLGKEDTHFMMVENSDFINYCMTQLSDKEVEFVKFRYTDEMSQKEIAAIWSVSQMYVSRFERKVLEKLKNLYFKD